MRRPPGGIVGIDAVFLVVVIVAMAMAVILVAGGGVGARAGAAIRARLGRGGRAFFLAVVLHVLVVLGAFFFLFLEVLFFFLRALGFVLLAHDVPFGGFPPAGG